ncbi:MAG TPA: hypothetical protein VGL38_09415 [bacterium]|jgi:hypothetical protein
MTSDFSYDQPALDVEYDFVAIIDLLPDEDRERFDLSGMIKSLFEHESISCRRFDCANISAFENAVSRLTCSAQSEKFFIHVVGHGSEDGIGIGEFDFLTWSELRKALVPMNELMSGSLILNMTTCRGIHAVKSVSIGDTTYPFFGLIGPKDDLGVADAIDINMRLYRKWIAGGSINEIVRAVNAELNQDIIYCISAEGYKKIRTGQWPSTS